MFEDIVKSKFEGVDLGNREIEPEIRAQLRKGLDYGMGQIEELEDEEIDTELRDLVNTFFDQNIDEMAQMYLDAFTADELITMLDFEMTPLAKKKLDISFKLQKFIIDGLAEFMRNYEIPEEKIEWEELRSDISKMSMEDEQSFVWDTKE